MKRLMKHSLSLLLCSALFITQIMGVTKVATGGSGTTTNQTFGQNSAGTIQASAFYKPLGAYFAGQANGASNNAICYATRPAADLAPTFSGIASAASTAANANIRNSSIAALAVVGNPTSDATRRDLNEVRIVFTSSQGNNKAVPVGISCMTVTGGTPVYLPMRDSNVTPAATINTFTVVAGNSGTQMCAFAAVKGGAAAAATRGNFGLHADDAIVSVAINPTGNILTRKTAYSASSTVLTTSLAFGAVGTNQVNAPALCYDETLKRLYVGVQYTSAAAGTHSGGLGVQIYDVNPTGQLSSLYSCGVPTAGLQDGGIAMMSNKSIIGTKGTAQSIAILNLKVMHTSTGPSSAVKFAYLIVNGGNGTAAAVSNRIWAVPLVVGSTSTITAAEATGNTNIGAINGTFANVRTANFSTRASAAGDLYTTGSAAARVGGGPLPCPVTTAPSDMWVDGDTVYCSISATASATTTGGIWYSQAIFDRFGKIANWTEWAKAAPAELSGSFTDGGVKNIAIDSKTTRIWAVNNAGTALRMTNWEKSSFDATAAAPVAAPLGFLTNINTTANLGDGCTAVCDLNSSTTAWGASTPQRIALLGGLDGKVCFVKTGSAIGSTPKVPHSAGLLISTHTGLHWNFDQAGAAGDYSNSATLLKTTIPNGKTVTCLAYSGWDSNTVGGPLTNGFFFAGTDEDGGLYVWAKADGTGFNTRNDIRNFDSDPFRTATGTAANYRSWQKLDRIDGTPTKIRARGGAVYILTRQGGINQTDRIYRITRKNDTTSLNTDFVVTASTGQGSLANVKRIVDFVISTSATSAYAGEQLTMLTNDGIYTTSSSQGTNGIVRDYNSAQLNAGWYQMTTPSTAGTAQFFLAQPSHNRAPQTFWYSQWVANANDATIYNKNELYALNAQSSLDRSSKRPTANWPESFANASINAFDRLGGTEPSDFAQNDIFTNFYSDGARRLFCKVSGTTYKLASRPYEVSTEGWDMTSDYTTFGKAFDGVTFIHWISTLGDSGKLYVGTDKGVIGLI